MRDIKQLNLNDGGKPVSRLPPGPDVLSALEIHFNVRLPAEYVEFLNLSNGGHPELDTIQHDLSGREFGSPVNRFFILDSDIEHPESVWKNSSEWAGILGPKSIVIAGDGGGNVFFIDCNDSPSYVKFCNHEERFSVVDIAPSFSEFVDKLSKNPDYI